MKKITRNVAMIAIVALSAATMLSCNDTEKKDAAPAKAKTEAGKSSSNLPNYRYVDLDTILSRYNLAKDYNEEMLRLQNNGLAPGTMERPIMFIALDPHFRPGFQFFHPRSFRRILYYTPKKMPRCRSIPQIIPSNRIQAANGTFAFFRRSTSIGN